MTWITAKVREIGVLLNSILISVAEVYVNVTNRFKLHTYGGDQLVLIEPAGKVIKGYCIPF